MKAKQRLASEILAEVQRLLADLPPTVEPHNVQEERIGSSPGRDGWLVRRVVDYEFGNLQSLRLTLYVRVPAESSETGAA